MVKKTEDQLMNDVLEEVKKTEKKVNKTPLKELPEEELTMDDKLFEIKHAIEKSTSKTMKGLQHLEKKIDFIYNIVSGRTKKR